MRLLKRWLTIVLIPVVCVVVACGATVVLANRIIRYEYAANTMVYVSRNRNESYEAAQQSIYQELLASRELARDFSNFAESEAMLQQLQRNLGQQMPWLLSHRYDAGDHFIVTKGDDQSRIVEITVYCDNPYDAASIANESAQLIRNLSLLVYGDDFVQVVKTAVPNTAPANPEKKTIFLVACCAGLLVGIAADGVIIWGSAQKRSHRAVYSAAETGNKPKGRNK